MELTFTGIACRDVRSVPRVDEVNVGNNHRIIRRRECKEARLLEKYGGPASSLDMKNATGLVKQQVELSRKQAVGGGRRNGNGNGDAHVHLPLHPTARVIINDRQTPEQEWPTTSDEGFPISHLVTARSLGAHGNIVVRQTALCIPAYQSGGSG